MQNVKKINNNLSVMVGKMSGSAYPRTSKLAKALDKRVDGSVTHKGGTIYYGKLKMAETSTDGKHMNVKLLPFGKKANTAKITTHKGLSFKQAMSVINQHVTENIPNANGGCR